MYFSVAWEKRAIATIIEFKRSNMGSLSPADSMRRLSRLIIASSFYTIKFTRFNYYSLIKFTRKLCYTTQSPAFSHFVAINYYREKKSTDVNALIARRFIRHAFRYAGNRRYAGVSGATRKSSARKSFARQLPPPSPPPRRLHLCAQSSRFAMLGVFLAFSRTKAPTNERIIIGPLIYATLLPPFPRACSRLWWNSQFRGDEIQRQIPLCGWVHHRRRNSRRWRWRRGDGGGFILPVVNGYVTRHCIEKKNIIDLTKPLFWYE